MLLSSKRLIDEQVLRRTLDSDPSVQIAFENQAVSYVTGPRFSFRVMCVPATYLPPDRLAAEIKEVRLSEAVAAHKAFVSISVDHTTPTAQRAESATRICQLAAELVDDTTLALWDTPANRLILPTAEAIELMRAGKREEAFRAITWDGISKMGTADLSAEIAEAQRRFPEFVAAFKDAPDKSDFIIKFHFLEEGVAHCEHMWVQPEEIDESTVTGRLLNQPRWLRRVREGDLVTMKVEDMSDWGMIQGDTAAGFFTEKRVRQGR